MSTPVKLSNPVHFLAFGFGSGLAPKAPGTFGTLAAIPLYLLLSRLSLPMYVAVLALASLLGVWLCGKTAKDLKTHDHPGIVWDEFCGYWLTMLATPADWFWIITGFILFRLFDIWKPWPVSLADRRVPGGTGIMLDDLIAGLYALMVMQVIVFMMT